MSNFDNIISAREAAISAKLLDPTTNDPNMDAIYKEYKDVFYQLFRGIYDSAERGQSQSVFQEVEELLMDDDDFDIKDLYDTVEQLEGIRHHELKKQSTETTRAKRLNDAIAAITEIYLGDIMLALDDIQTFLRAQGYACSLSRLEAYSPLQESFSLTVSWAHLSQK